MTGPEVPSRASPEARRRTRRRHERRSAGRHLLAGIDAVLPHLTSATGTRALVERLRVALARTAARGDTCRVPQAADGVRTAANLLLAGSTDEARQALRNARADLVDAPESG